MQHINIEKGQYTLSKLGRVCNQYDRHSIFTIEDCKNVARVFQGGPDPDVIEVIGMFKPIGCYYSYIDSPYGIRRFHWNKDDDAAAEKFPHGEVCYSYSKYLKGIFGNYFQILNNSPSIYAK